MSAVFTCLKFWCETSSVQVLGFKVNILILFWNHLFRPTLHFLFLFSSHLCCVEGASVFASSPVCYIERLCCGLTSLLLNPKPSRFYLVSIDFSCKIFIMKNEQNLFAPLDETRVVVAATSKERENLFPPLFLFWMRNRYGRRLISIQAVTYCMNSRITLPVG